MEKQNDKGTPRVSDRLSELETTCFVIMPFGKKKVGGKEVNFDSIYHEIFEPAINCVKTPEDENKTLIAKRTDMDAFSSSVNQEMFEYILYSRMAFADISGFNPNVFYEIGARHSAQESGTILFRQTGHAIPFDITSIKVFEYDNQPNEKKEDSRSFITNVISETLKRNRLDSPVRLALRAQWSGDPSPELPHSSPQNTESPTLSEVPMVDPLFYEKQWNKKAIGRFMREAEEATRLGDLEMARVNYWSALRFDPLNIIARMRLGLTLRNMGRHYQALEEFATITKFEPNYGEAWREKGIIEGRIARMISQEDRQKATWLPDGYESLHRAIHLIPNDFDAWSSLGGILKNVRGDMASAKKMYKHAARISNSHPYPLLNALKLEALNTGKLDLKPIKNQLEKAKEMRLAQTLAMPPTDTPWCYFDLAEIHLYQNDTKGFLDYIKKGVQTSKISDDPKSFLDSLTKTLVEKKITLDGLNEGLDLLKKEILSFDQKKK